MLNKMMKSVVVGTVITLGLSMIGCESTEDKEERELAEQAKQELNTMGENDVINYLENHDSISVEEILEMTYNRGYDENGERAGFGVEAPHGFDLSKEYIRGIMNEIEFDDKTIDVDYIDNEYDRRVEYYGTVDIDEIQFMEEHVLNDNNMEDFINSIIVPIYGTNSNLFEAVLYEHEDESRPYKLRIDINSIVSGKTVKRIYANIYTHDYTITDVNE